MSPVPFHKMHGCGNDCVVLDGRARLLALTPEAIRRLADRHRGVGFDQLVLILPPRDDGLAFLRFFNADGGEAEACGNATRCVASLLLDQTGRRSILLESLPGSLPAERLADGSVRVEMTVPRLDWRDIPLAVPCDTLEVPLDRPPLPRPVAVSMGNPHAVFLVPDLATLDVAGLGAELERHPIFPERANIGFARMLGPDAMRLRVFERGAGLTLACGSGACAAMVAAVRRGLAGDRLRVLVDGGELLLEWPGEGPVAMSGPASLSFTGELAPELLDG
jgi:diaminopimelate epimerase